MNILVTGANGFIGKHVIDALATNHKVIKCGSMRARGKDVLKVNLSSSRSVKSLIGKIARKRIDVIVHLSARMCDASNAKSFSILEDNLKITENVVSIAKALKPKLLIHASSIAVYPSDSSQCHEDSRIDMSKNSDCLYGLAKFNAEILFNHFLGNDMKVTNLRIAQVYGPGMRKDRIVPTFIRELKENNTITVYGKGERVTNFVHVDDVVRAIIRIISKPVEGTFNLAHQKNFSTLQLAQQIKRQYSASKATIKKVAQGSNTKQFVKANKLENKLKVANRRINFKDIEV